MSTTESMDIDDHSSSLLEKLQAMIELEKSLTESLEHAEPWLSSTSTTSTTTQPRVRPIPSTMEQAHRVLAVARNLAARTSAPAGWNPTAPVVGFSTPNPLPHQLRGGALAALQLERARQVELDRKRQKQQQQQDFVATKKAEAVAEEEDDDMASSTEVDPKRRDMRHKERVQHRTARVEAPAQPKVQVSMNLSDSSSSDEEDSD